MRIGFCYNVKPDGVQGFQREVDFDSLATIDAIIKTIELLGHSVIRIEADENVFDKLKEQKGNIDLVFNIAEGLYGDARESWVPLACEILKIPYTHSTPTVHALKLDKGLAKLAVKGLGMSVPASVLYTKGDEVSVPNEIVFPIIIKPNAEGSSIGIFDNSIVKTREELKGRLEELFAKGLTGELLIEEYIEGREFTVSVLEQDGKPTVLPIIEQRFDILPPGMNKVAGYELKWMIEDTLDDLTKAYDCPAKVDDSLKAEIEKTSRKIFSGLKVRDCARIDYRLKENGALYFLEINTLPGINPDETVISYFPISSRKAGMKYPQLVEAIITSACRRYKLSM